MRLPAGTGPSVRSGGACRSGRSRDAAVTGSSHFGHLRKRAPEMFSQEDTLHPSRLLAACVIVCIPALASACTESPTAVTEAAAESPEPLLSATAAADESALITFETLSYNGREEDGTRVDLDVSILDVVGAVSPSDIVGAVTPSDFQALHFFGPDGGKGRFIEGAGLIRRTPQGVEGLGRLVDVPVTGTRTNADGTVEQVEGTLMINLIEDVVEPIKGDFFFSCGDECLRFQIEATFQEADGPIPCLLTGTFTAGLPAVQSS